MTAVIPLIAVVGNDVPRQLVLAAGARPHRLTGAWDAPDAEAQELLGATDAAASHILAELRRDAHGFAGVVVCGDSQAHVRLFYALRATGASLPVHLLDLPREDSVPARRFGRFQLESLVDFCAGVTGRRPGTDALREAAAAEQRLGQALDALRARRRADPPRCTGADALAAYLAASRLDPAAALAVVDAARSTTEEDAVRVHMTGSNHPDASIYHALEARGCVVTGEDHDTGDGAWLGVAVDSGDLDTVIDGLLDAHFARTGASSTEFAAARAALTVATSQEDGADAVAALIRDLDEAPLWDLADQSERLAARGIRLVVRSRVRGGDAVDAAAELAEELREAVAA